MELAKKHLVGEAKALILLSCNKCQCSQFGEMWANCTEWIGHTEAEQNERTFALASCNSVCCEALREIRQETMRKEQLFAAQEA